MRQITPKKLSEILEQHRLWLDSNGKKGQKANLEKADLRETDLSEALLSKANLKGVLLNNACLNHAELRGANLQAASLNNADLTCADLSKTNLSNTDLRRANLSSADLQRANLKQADMSFATLDSVVFVNANLCETILNYARLDGAVLDNANLTSAKLLETRFDYCYLRNSNLNQANLLGTSFLSCNLKNTNFSKAKMGNTIFSNIDLSSAIFKNIEHHSPSSIGIDTLFKSQGNIPHQLLRDAGVPEIMIEYADSLLFSPIQYYSAFISYSHKDEAFAKQLHSALRDIDARVWFAPEDMKRGQKMHEQINQAIRHHDKLLIVLSEKSMDSSWVKHEIKKARQEEREQNKRKLFPISIVPFEKIKQWELIDADEGRDLAQEIREYYIPDFSDWKNHDTFAKEFAKLRKDMQLEIADS